jgi:hypothetical protein
VGAGESKADKPATTSASAPSTAGGAKAEGS